MTRPPKTLSRIVLAALAAGAPLACSSTPGGSRSGVTGEAILTLEDDRGDAETRETLTMLRLPLPGLGGPEGGTVEWAQLETRGAADLASAAVAVDDRHGLALVAEESGVRLVRTGADMQTVGRHETGSPVGSVSLAPGGLAVALSAGGADLHLYRATPGGLTHEGVFPLAVALGPGARASAALLSPAGDGLAVLDAGRSSVVMFTPTRGAGAVGFEMASAFRAGEGLAAGAWTPDGSAFVVAERLLSDETLEGVKVVAASGRVSVYSGSGGEPARAALPGLPHSMALDRRGRRAACVLDTPAGPELALVALDRRGAALLDSRPINDAAAGVAFDARGGHVLVALPEQGGLGVWAIEGAALRDTGKIVDTGPGVTAVAVAGE